METCFWSGEPVAILVTGVIASAVAVWGYASQHWQSRADGRAVMYSEALRAVEDYAEAPYIVRRRSGRNARANITTQISEIQSRLSYYCALLEISAHAEISQAYLRLVNRARADAGAEMTRAWCNPRIRRDAKVAGQPRFDRSGIDRERGNFLSAVQEHDRRASRRVKG